MNQSSPEQLLEACGALGPLQFEIEHQERHETLRRTLALPFGLVGRAERADLPLDDPRVSRRHAYLQVVAGRLWCVDLDSRTGTYEEQGGSSPSILCGRQRLRIGPFALRLLDGCPEGEDPTNVPNPFCTESYDPSALPPVGLDFVEGTTHQPLWLLDRVVTLVGSAWPCKVRLHSPTVSRTHCALCYTSAGLWVIDLLSSKGTRVNGTSVRWARLDDGDEVRIGQFLIRVRFLGRPTGKTALALPPASVDASEAVTGLLPLEKPLVACSPLTETLPADLEGLLSSAMPLVSTSATVSAGGGSEALLMPLVTQFSLMQQHMFDQFQQALLMMVRMFSGLHRDQLQLVRQELKQLHEVTRELQSLQTELAKQGPAPTQPGTTPSGELPTAPAPKPAASAATPARLGTTGPIPSPLPSIRTSVPAQATAAADAAPGPFAEAPVRSEADVHAWLSQRLADLQRERQSRWQKIVNVLTGKRQQETVA